jgi:putative glutamine amidotransferase
MPAPLIGLTPSRNLNPQGLPMMTAMEAYTRSIAEAGGVPVIIPLGLGHRQLQDLYPRLDGVLFTGGGDIHPGRFSGKSHERVAGVDEDRDELEIRLFQELALKGTPFLGICRGLQALNVACGGKLYTHIADQHPNALEHTYYPDWPRDYLAHSIKVDENSFLASVLGETYLEVNSLHHQAISELAPGLLPTAYAPDGVIEAVEIPGHPFGLAVQWHPEWLQTYTPHRAIFRAFIEAVKAKSRNNYGFI